MTHEQWIENLPAAITVSDAEGYITYMNKKSIATFNNSGGEELIGTKLSNCHNSLTNEKILNLISNNQTNTYTIEKNGIKKLIFQSPIYDEDVYLGIIELSIVLPENMSHFIRK